jgi:hypothetical protein
MALALNTAGVAWGLSASAGGSGVSPSFSPPAASQVWAFIAIDGDQVVGTVTSSPAQTWTRLYKDVGSASANGDLEVWYANIGSAPGATTITATQVAGTHAGSTGMYVGVEPVVFTGAETTPGGATSVLNSSTLYTSTLSVTTTRAGSYVLGIGNDQNSSTARTIGTAQTMIADTPDPIGDRFWVQRTTALVSASGTATTVNDTAPTQLGLFRAIEIRAVAAVTTRPFKPVMSILNAVSRAANF